MIVHCSDVCVATDLRTLSSSPGTLNFRYIKSGTRSIDCLRCRNLLQPKCVVKRSVKDEQKKSSSAGRRREKERGNRRKKVSTKGRRPDSQERRSKSLISLCYLFELRRHTLNKEMIKIRVHEKGLSE